MTGPGINGSAGLTFTTTQVGKICGVSQQAVIKWVDSGRLQGYRLPESHARRVTRDSLLKFMHENRLPEDILNDKVKLKVLVVEDEDTVADMVELVFEDQQGVEVKKVGRGFDAGVVSDYRPDVVILDIMLPDMDGRRVCELITFGQRRSGYSYHRRIGVPGFRGH